MLKCLIQRIEARRLRAHCANRLTAAGLNGSRLDMSTPTHQTPLLLSPKLHAPHTAQAHSWGAFAAVLIGANQHLAPSQYNSPTTNACTHGASRISHTPLLHHNPMKRCTCGFEVSSQPALHTLPTTISQQQGPMCKAHRRQPQCNIHGPFYKPHITTQPLKITRYISS